MRPSGTERLGVHPSAAGGFHFRKSGPDLLQQVGTNNSTASGRLVVSSVGSATGMFVPGIRSPCLAGEVSTTDLRRLLSTPARSRRATAREAAPYPTTVLPAAC